MPHMPDIIEITLTVDSDNRSLKPSLLLANHTGLSQAKIKDAMQKGSVWLTRGNSTKRLRRASRSLNVSDQLTLNYNEELLSQTVPEPTLVHDAHDYSVWFKPYGLHCQGSRWGDFASINRWVEVNLPKKLNTTERPVFIVHRLDRATSGLILLCHSKTAARLFSAMFQTGEMDKRYQAVVHGNFSDMPQDYVVSHDVDNKSAKSVFTLLAYKDGCSLLNVQLLSGRKHQIRQHLSTEGFPIVGDRLYGGNAEHNEDVNLQLQSVSLEFKCPITNTYQCFTVLDHQRLTL